MQLEKVKRAGRDLVSADESPSLKAVDILCAAGNFNNKSQGAYRKVPDSLTV